MASEYDKYLAALAADAGDNVYSDLGGVSKQLGLGMIDYVRQPGADIGEAMLYSSILGMLGGGLSKFGESQAADEVSLASKVLTGATRERPEGLPESIYKKAATYRDIIAASRAQELAQKEADAERDLLYSGKKGLQSRAIELGTIDDQAIAEERAMQLLSGDIDPKDGGGEVQKDETGVIKPGILTERGKRLYEMESALRKDFESDSQIQKGFYVEQKAKNLSKALVDPRSQADIEIIPLLIQTIEPALAVRTDDRTAVAESPNIPSSLKAKYRKYIQGDSSLGNEVRQGLLEIARRQHGEAKSYYDRKAGQFSELARRNSVDPRNIILQQSLSSWDDIMKEAEAYKQDFNARNPDVSLDQEMEAFAKEGITRGLSDMEISQAWQEYVNSRGAQ